MRRLISRIARSARRPLALAACAAFAAYSLLPLSGCMGGSSSEVGNPITLVFYQDGKRVKFDGLISIVEAGTNPEFFYEYPDGGTTPPYLDFGAGSDPAPTWLVGVDSLVLDHDTIRKWLYRREQLRLRKATAAAGVGAQADTLPDFNIILRVAGNGAPEEKLGAWLAGVHARDRGYSTATGDSGRAFEIDLTPGHSCSGEVDSTASAGPPLALFVPGSPYYALVRGDGGFEFVGLPAGRLPLRWITSDGRIFAVPESLGVEGGGPTPAAYAFSGPVHAGERLDSIAMPVPYPTLASPLADPIGPYSFSDSVVVSLHAQPGAEIRFTTDSTSSIEKWKKYTQPLVMRVSTTLRTVAIASGYNTSPMVVNNYILAPASPAISPAPGRFVDSVRVTLTGPAGSTLRYTVDGNAPTDTSTIYRGPVTLRTSAIIQAIAVIPGLGSSAAVSAEYVIETDSLAAPPPHP